MKNTLFFALLVLLFTTSELIAQVKWTTGKALEKKLQTPLAAINWESLPLRPTLLKFASAQKISIFLDRRVDPTISLKCSLRNVTPLEILTAVCEEKELGLTQVGNVIYIGPADYTEKLRSHVLNIRDMVLKLSSDTARKRWSAKLPIQWEKFAPSRAVIAELLEKKGVKIMNLDEIPHDIWPAYTLPPMPLADAVTLLLGQFNMSFKFNTDGAGTSIHITALKLEDVKIRPDAKLVRKTSRPKGTQAAKRDSMRFSGEVGGPFHATVAKICEQHGLFLSTTAQDLDLAGLKSTKMVVIKIQMATLEQMLTELAQAGGCKIKMVGETLSLIPDQDTQKPSE